MNASFMAVKESLLSNTDQCSHGLMSAVEVDPRYFRVGSSAVTKIIAVDGRAKWKGRHSCSGMTPLGIDGIN